MKRKLLCITLALGLLASGTIFWLSNAERWKANRIIAAIEHYQGLHGALPDARDHDLMKKLGFDLRAGWHPSYQVRADGEYRIVITTGFDGPYWTYDSSSRRWDKGH